MNIIQQLYYDIPGEVLTGYVQGKTASDIEERFMRAQTILDVKFQFRQGWSPLLGFLTYIVNDPGDLEVDSLSRWYGRFYPILIQGEISHFYTSEQAEKDRSKIARINEIFQPLHAHPVIVIPFTMLKNQDDTNQLVRDGFVNGWTQQRFYEI
jgi:hypothetical protein